MKVIDCQCHWYPRAYFEAIRGRSSYPRCSVQKGGYRYEPCPGEIWEIPPNYVELEMQFEDMERSGVDIMVSSPAVYGDVSGLEQVEAIEIAQLFNEAMSAAQNTYSGKYFGIAVLPLQDPASAVRLLDDAVLRLGIKAVLLHSNINGKPLGQPALWPVFKRIQDHSIPIFLHPTRSIMANDLPYGLEVTLGYVMDTTAAALSLIYSGVLDAFPELRIVHPHVGGVLPYILGRVEKENDKPWSGDRSTAQSVFSYMRHFYTDTVSNHPGVLRLAIDTYGLDHMLFASDYPYWDVADGIDFVRRNLEQEDAADVLGRHAHELLKLPED